MENRVNKPPKSAMAYYVKLFCKKKSSSSKEPGEIQKALKSWFLLSAAEQQPFFEKFNKCQQEYEKKYAIYLKSVKPFMKRKLSRHKEDKSCTSEKTEVINHEIQFQTSRNILKNTDDIVSNDESICDQVYADVDLADQQEKYNQAIQRLPEPTPPSMRNGKQLFEAVNVIEGKKLEWKHLSQIERGKYNSAVLTIKRDYIKKYQNYLESLPAEELFQHYIKYRKNS